MKIALIITVVSLVLSLGLNVFMYRAAVKFTDKHHKTVTQLRRAKQIVRGLQMDVYELNKQLEQAEAECEKWKLKAVEISINAQKGTEGNV
jgi:hypothetical protein